jgi:hypothetical protein
MGQKHVVDPAKLANPDKLPKKPLAELVKHFGHLAELDADIAAATIRYLVAGGDEGVLLQLRGLKGADEELGVGGATKGSQWELSRSRMQERVRVYEEAAQAGPQFWIRLAQILDAIQPSAQKQTALPKGCPSWFVALIDDLRFAYQRHSGSEPIWSVDLPEAILKASAVPTDLLARLFLVYENGKVSRSYYAGYASSRYFHDWKGYFGRHLTAVRESLAALDAESRLHSLKFLAHVEFDFTPLVDLLVDLGINGQKTVRDEVFPHLHKHRDLASPLLDEVLANGDAAARHEAVQLLWRLFGRESIDRLKKHAQTEASERVKQTIEKLVSAPDEQPEDALKALAANLPPLEIELGVVDLPEAAKVGIRQALTDASQLALENYEKAMIQWKDPDRPKWMGKPEKPTAVAEKDVLAVINYVEGKRWTSGAGKEAGAVIWNENGENQLPYWARQAAQKALTADWLAPPDIKLVHVVRLIHLSNALSINGQGLHWGHFDGLERYRALCPQPFGLRELDAVVATLPKAKPGMTVAYYLSVGRYCNFCVWDAEFIWPASVEHPEPLDAALKPPAKNDYSWSSRRESAFRVLAMFPQLPAGYVPLLWDLALSENKGDRPLAQAALATVPDKASKVVVALKDGRQTVRAAAAEWLGKIGDKAAVEPLKEAFRKEKQELVKGAYMTALDALGADVNEFLDRGALLKEAKAGLAKKTPKGMDWVPFDRLPALHWEDTKEPVAPEIVRWWLVQGVQQKSAVAGPLLRRYLGMCRKHEATALAKYVLTAWIAQDTRVPNHEECMAKARKDADQQWATYSQHQYWIDAYKNDKENLVKQLFQAYSTQFLGSAIGEKGVLGVVTAAGDAACVKMCEQYIRKWFGNRLAQCKALVEVLAWIPHPLAIQALLGFATRFRTKAVRQLADEHVKALAEREGWTVDELADRTLPDAGFERPVDEAGKPVGDRAVLTLDYGPRKFTVTLDDELQPIITTEEGKKVKAPPAAGKADDAELAKVAKKAFGDAKKIVKEVVKRQSERFYEALCTQRSWKFEDWKRFLADHPIAGRLCVRLAWCAYTPAVGDAPERFLGCFRPLDDGSLTNEQDEEVKLPADAVIRLAHTCNTPAELGAAWLQHFKDYDVAPLFPQFGRTIYDLPEARKKETDVEDFQGHMLTTFKLRGKATKLGYIRGDAEDHGFFTLYRKPFPSLGMQAIVGFSGSGMPETDGPAALHTLYFIPLKSDNEAAYSYRPNKLPLGKVPPVLLSECHNDLRQMAAEGSGFDPEWSKRGYY